MPLPLRVPPDADDHDLARFLKARNYDLQAAKQMWEGMISWRRENRVDNIHEWFVFHERSEYEKVFPTGLHKTDKEVSARCASAECAE